MIKSKKEREAERLEKKKAKIAAWKKSQKEKRKLKQQEKKKISSSRNKNIAYKHQQHTNKFVKALNAPRNSNYMRPFRPHDMTWLFGKYKFVKMDDIPLEYLEWAYDTFNLSDTTKLIFTMYLDNRLHKENYK